MSRGQLGTVHRRRELLRAIQLARLQRAHVPSVVSVRLKMTALARLDGSWNRERQLDARDALLGLTATWSMTGLPALSIPAGLVDGLPVGLQLVAPAGREDLLLHVAVQLEESLERRGGRARSAR